MRGFFVTGTDTGVGKTIASAWLTLQTKSVYWKPIQTGTDVDPQDGDVVGQLIGRDYVIPSHYIFSAPLAPLHAAQKENFEISIADLKLPLAKSLIIEGAGGVMVPITSSFLMIDLMALWQLPVVVVARTTLGTINHTLLTVEALRQRQIPIAGVILNGEQNDLNCQAIAQWTQAPILGHLPFLPIITKDHLQRISPWTSLHHL
jgi:dethiobiotin synthetase/malonyl-CoA O-methyltransferase